MATGRARPSSPKPLHMNSDRARARCFCKANAASVRGIAFDFSKQHILAAVDGSLKRLKTDYSGCAAAAPPRRAGGAGGGRRRPLTSLQSSGKVRNFGVSNQNPMQIQLLKKRYVKQPIVPPTSCN